MRNAHLVSGEKMCKNCGNCSQEHGGRTIDDAIDDSLDSPI